jgi:hypothetical protein
MANITKKYSINAKGILSIDDDTIGIEDVDTGEFIAFADLLVDFDGRSIKMSINYDEEYGTSEE